MYPFLVAIQRNRHSLSANNIAKNINVIFPELNVSFLPILRNDALERFYKCNTLRKLRLKLAGRDDLSFIDNSDLSTNEKLTFHELLTEPYIDISFSVGRKNTTLSEKLKRFAILFTKHAKNSQTNTVLAVEVSGKEDESSASAIIDLLQDRLIHIGNVEVKGRSIDTNSLMRIACNAISSNYEELKKNAT